jgi:hypothetical protein
VRGLIARAGIDRLMYALSLIAVVVAGVVYINRMESHLNCQARYNDSINKRTRILTEASDRERASSRLVVDAQAAVFRHPAALVPREDRTPQQQREIDGLARAWGEATILQQQDRIDADKARAENPVPPPPSELCD